MIIKYNEALKEVRLHAKQCGLTFKRQNATINGKQAFSFYCRSTGEKVYENFTLWSAYENCLSGYIKQK